VAAPLRFGLIGYGLWGRHHAAAIAAAPGAALAGIACASAATAAAARRDFPSTPVTVDYRELLARPDLDAVAVVVPNHLHAEVGVAALEAGKDVLLEKPMATSLADCDRLLAAARTSGRVLTIGHELRHSAQYGRVKAIIDAGEIGTPTYAAFSLFRFPFRPGSDGWRYDAARVGSVVCFIVAKEFRGKGLASAMLDAACEKFQREGLAIAEGYPTTAAPSGPYADQIPWSAHNHTGPLEMYRTAGFTVHRQLERFAVVRKTL